MMNKQSFKSLLSFEFWQKFGKALMVVIAVMPAAGLMISLGKTIAMINPELGFLVVFLNRSVGGLSETSTSSLLSLSVVAGRKNVRVGPLQQVYPLS